MLNVRIVAFSETKKQRAQEQAGYQPNYRATDSVFVLNDLTEHQQPIGCSLYAYACVVDLKKAFDTVPNMCCDRSCGT